VEQHAPVGQGLGEQEVFRPRKLLAGAVAQLAATVRVQAAVSVLQQAPVQGLRGEQVEPLPWKAVFAPVHRVAVEEVQPPLTVLQQAPPQGLGVQEEPRPWKTLVPVQPAAVVVEQVPVVVQQAPPQGFGEHEAPAPW
jgi:hypothetical protein